MASLRITSLSMNGVGSIPAIAAIIPTRRFGLAVHHTWLARLTIQLNLDSTNQRDTRPSPWALSRRLSLLLGYMGPRG